ncbi:HepT-like ribonuclease domain-containing protein [Marinomonas spartinae]|uniref:HepT-like ribonuclease domain-containing protein n=1 Tax=Marinomonas spartinae TaxID=1792290 RepID=UPI0018F2435D|nr:HepT-like ribonuclease domain-containing protein [Marinomonas spartinae]MBJ7555692.1 DUF86 domain-containing protein [Marinomonas spartinae]
MRDIEWEQSLYRHQHDMIVRLDKFRKRDKSLTLTKDESMAIEHAFQLLVASMLDLARYVLKHHYQVSISSRDEVFAQLVSHNDVTLQQAEQIRFLIELRDKILHDYLSENFDMLEDAMSLRRYSLVETLTQEWLAQLDNNLKEKD